MKIYLSCDYKKREKPSLKISFDKVKKDLENQLDLNNKKISFLLENLRSIFNKTKNRKILLLLRHYDSFEQESEMLLTFRKLKYSCVKESSNLSDTCLINILKLSINDYELPNITPIESYLEYGEMFHKLDFNTGLFDSLRDETLNILENIYNSDTYKAINSDIWKEYVQDYDEEFNIIENVTVKKDINAFFSPSWEYANSNTNLTFEKGVTTEEDLLHTFLGILFSCPKSNYIIKKCENCGKFFIAQRIDDKTCNRKYTELSTCKEYFAKQSKIKYQNQYVAKLEKKVRDLYSSGYAKQIVELNKFNKEYKLKRQELSGKDYLYWLVSHYSKDDTISKYHSEINNYIEENPNFEHDFKRKYHR